MVMDLTQASKPKFQAIAVTYEYVWINKAGKIRSRTKQVIITKETDIQIGNVPKWELNNEARYLLAPVRIVADVARLPQNTCFIVLCELQDKDGNAIPDSKSTHHFKEAFNADTVKDMSRIPTTEFQQGYVLDSEISFNSCVGRTIAENHRLACLGAGLHYLGMNANNVEEGEWVFKIGARSVGESAGTDIVELAKELIIARYLLVRAAEHAHQEATYHPASSLVEGKLGTISSQTIKFKKK